MQIKVSGANMEVGQALTSFVEEHLAKSVTKYFDKAVSGEVHFSKEKNHLFKTVIIVNDGVKDGVVIKSDAEAADVYGCFTEALNKAVHQLQRYKDRIKNHRRQGVDILFDSEE